jgi:flagellar biosynthesis/type III secretory pathway M-ring protein FliF/YscJ
MNVITPWLVCVALLVTLVGVVYVALKRFRTQTQEIKSLTAQLESQKRVAEELVNHAEDLSKIKGDKEEVAQKISEATTDEEVNEIISNLVRANNDRVRNKAKGKK